MANETKVPETVKLLKGYKSPAALAAELNVNESAARARIKAVQEAGYALDTRQGTRDGDRGRFPTEYKVKPGK